MSKVTTRPNATPSNDFDVTGASAHAALSDNSDATLISIPQATGGDDRSCRLGFAEPSIPAGAVLKEDRIRIKANKSGAGYPPMRLTSVRAYPNGSSLAGEAKNVDVGYVAKTTTTVLKAANAIAHSQLELVIEAHTFDVNILDVGEIFEVYWDTYYVEQPTVDSVSVSPTSPISDDDTPTISWTQTADADGGFPSKHQVKVFSDAQYLAGGFDPATSAATVDSGVIDSLATDWELSTNLPDDTYRAFVRVANVVNGVDLWSDWAYVQFDLAVLRPAVPTLTVTPEDANGRILVRAQDPGGGAVGSTNFQIQRSRDGGASWDYIRTVDDFSLIAPGDIGYDYETGNGEVVKYRARALHTFATGATSKSGWTVSANASWSSFKTWIKHPTRPDLNLIVQISSQAGRRRAARKSRKDALGREDPIVVYDSARSGNEGEVTFMVEEDDLDAFEELLEAQVPLLVQTPVSHRWPDRWLALGDLDSQRYADRAQVEEGLKAFTWDEVAVPSGELVAWQ